MQVNRGRKRQRYRKSAAREEQDEIALEIGGGEYGSVN